MDNTESTKPSREEFFQALEEISKTFNEIMDSIKQEQEDYWNKLSEEDRLKVFCAVVRRIHDGELVKNHSYRGMLYDVFGFGPEAYVQAQMSGYMDIHNILCDPPQEAALIDFCRYYNIDDYENKIKQYIDISRNTVL